MHTVAIIGFGGMGQWHARNTAQSGFARVIGVFDTEPEKCALARQMGLAVFASLDALLASDAQICIITTPNDAHCDLAIRCLRAGKHVLVEKPMACDMHQLTRMYDAAHEAGKVLSVNQNRRFDVDFLAMKQLIQGGTLGKVISLESRIHGSRGIPGAWRKDPARGGGMLYDWGVHLVDQMLLLFEGHKVKTVQCTLSFVTGQPVDDGFYLTLIFDDGARGYIEVNTCNYIALPRFYLSCRYGTAQIRDWQEPCRVVACFDWDENSSAKAMSPRDASTTKEYEIPRPTAEGMRLFENFCNAADGTQELLVTEEQVKTVMQVLMAAFASAEKQGTPVNLE